MMLLRHILISIVDETRQERYFPAENYLRFASGRLPIEPLALLVICIRKLSIASLSAGSVRRVGLHSCGATTFVLKRPTPMNRTDGAICFRKLSIWEFCKSRSAAQIISGTEIETESRFKIKNQRSKIVHLNGGEQ